MLPKVLEKEHYALGLSPGFFRFYSEIGFLHGLDDFGFLRPTHVTGASAGALVGGFLAAGMSPVDMIKYVLSIERKDIWDVGGFGGLLKGKMFQELVESHLPVKTFEECKIPLGVTAYDLTGFRTNCIVRGNIAAAVVASCTFPGLFQPQTIDGSPHIDGGVWDHNGMMALPKCIVTNSTEYSGSEEDYVMEREKNQLIVNVVCGQGRIACSRLPKALQHQRLLTVVLENIPMVHPFSMSTMGPLAYKITRAATHRAMHSCHMQELARNHWVCHIDGNGVRANVEYWIPAEITMITASTVHKEALPGTALAAAGTVGTNGVAPSSEETEIEHVQEVESTVTAATSITTTYAPAPPATASKRRSNKRAQSISGATGANTPFKGKEEEEEEEEESLLVDTFFTPPSTPAAVQNRRRSTRISLLQSLQSPAATKSTQKSRKREGETLVEMVKSAKKGRKGMDVKMEADVEDEDQQEMMLVRKASDVADNAGAVVATEGVRSQSVRKRKQESMTPSRQSSLGHHHDLENKELMDVTVTTAKVAKTMVTRGEEEGDSNCRRSSITVKEEAQRITIASYSFFPSGMFEFFH